MTVKETILRVCAVGVLITGCLSANITITNPNFELPNQAGGYTYFIANCSSPCSAVNNGWTYSNTGGSGGAGVTGNANAFTNGNANAPTGVQVLFLQNESSASQALTGFQAGVTYTLSFDLAYRQKYDVGPQQSLNVTLGSQTLFGGLSINNGPAYTPETVNFTATGTQTLTFAGLQTGFDTTDFLDNVSITSTTPEPGYLGVLFAGILGLISLKRYRAQAQSR
jgi:cell surface hyaluronidase